MRDLLQMRLGACSHDSAVLLPQMRWVQGMIPQAWAQTWQDLRELNLSFTALTGSAVLA